MTSNCHHLMKLAVESATAHIKPRVVVDVQPHLLDLVACLQLQLFPTESLIETVQLEVNTRTHGHDCRPSSPLDNLDKVKGPNDGLRGLIADRFHDPIRLIHKTWGDFVNDEDEFCLACGTKRYLAKQHNIHGLTKQDHREHVHSSHNKQQIQKSKVKSQRVCLQQIPSQQTFKCVVQLFIKTMEILCVFYNLLLIASLTGPTIASFNASSNASMFPKCGVLSSFSASSILLAICLTSFNFFNSLTKR